MKRSSETRAENARRGLAEKLVRVRTIAAELGVGERGSERICAGLEAMFAPVIAGEDRETVTMHLPGLRSQPLWDDQRDAFPAVAGLEASFEAIVLEFRRLRDADLLRHYTDARLVDAGAWGQLHLRVQSRLIEHNVTLCPVTSGLLFQGGPYVGVTYFSAHAAGTRVRGHHGPGNYRIRCHLGLEIPEHCGMRVGDASFRWQEGRCVLLDDAFFHEVWNDGPSARSILLTDFWHPDLHPEELRVFERLMSEPSERASGLRRAIRATEQPFLPREFWNG